jgi:ubiquinone/menaquinone biosynthesis C-methylase UbiE
MPAHYDDSAFSYSDYWRGREYEHISEILALRSLLDNSRFKNSVDIGGGFGRLTWFLAGYSRHVTLIEPSVKQRRLAAKNLAALIGKKAVSVISGTAQKTNLPDNSQDLVIIIRLMHHLPRPQPVFKELDRIIKPRGILIIEFANSLNFKARIKSLVSGQPILPVPVERRSPANIKKQTIPFVNHNPMMLTRQLTTAGFSIEKTFSVSNFRSPFIKHLIPLRILTYLEKNLQPVLAPIFFGPSIFFLARKNVS